MQSVKPTSAEGYYMCVDWTVELRADALTLHQCASVLSELGRKTLQSPSVGSGMSSLRAG